MRLQQLRQALARQRMEMLFRGLPMPAAGQYLAQQQLGRLAVGQPLGKLHRLGPAADQGGDKGLLQDFRRVRLCGKRPEKLACRGLWIGLADGEPAHQELAEHPARRGLANPVHGAGRRVGSGAGGQQGKDKNDCAASATTVLH